MDHRVEYLRQTNYASVTTVITDAQTRRRRRSIILVPLSHINRQRLWSSATWELVVSCTIRSMIGDRAIDVAVHGSLPDSLHKLSSLNNFKKRLKSHLLKITGNRRYVSTGSEQFGTWRRQPGHPRKRWPEHRALSFWCLECCDGSVSMEGATTRRRSSVERERDGKYNRLQVFDRKWQKYICNAPPYHKTEGKLAPQT